MDKNQIRKIALERRSAIDLSTRENKSGSVSKILINFLSDCTDPILFYYPIKSELNILSAFHQLSDKEIYFPKTIGNDIIFYRTTSLSDFEKGMYNIPEPKVSEDVFCNRSGICITPGVAFDILGNRVGYGKGYYDRFFAKNSRLIKIGTTYSELIFEKIDAEPTDAKMDYILTDAGLSKLR